MFVKTFCLLAIKAWACRAHEEESLNEKVAGFVDVTFHDWCVPQITTDMFLEPTKPLSNELVGVVISTSKYFQNYRHQSNAMAIYRLMKQLGVSERNVSAGRGGADPGDPGEEESSVLFHPLAAAPPTPLFTISLQLYLFLGECLTCDPRNVLPGKHFIEAGHRVDLAEGPEHAAFKNQLASSRSWKILLTGRFMTPYHTLRSRFLPDRRERDIIVYISGHGGPEFTKFKDYDELTMIEIDRALIEMKLRGGYNRLMILIDSCQAFTIGERLTAPDAFIIASSARGYNAFACNQDLVLGSTLSDEFTYSSFEILRKKPKLTIGSWLDLISQDPRVTSVPQLSPNVNISEPISNWLAAPRFRHVINPKRKRASNNDLDRKSWAVQKILLRGPHA